jgi:hypothetical protein
MRRALLLWLSLAVLAGCASVRPATMVLPEDLAAESSEVTVRGLGGGRKGEFSVAGHRGSFTRSADRLDVFEVVSFDWGGSSLTIEGADIPVPAAAKCGLRQVTARYKIVQFAARPLAYECDYTGANATLSLQEAKDGKDWLVSRARRRGQASVDDYLLELRSVHELEGTPLTVEAPFGYVLEHAGRAVGAIELNGSTPRLWLPAQDAALRRAVLLAALPLALLWDPAALY